MWLALAIFTLVQALALWWRWFLLLLVTAVDLGDLDRASRGRMSRDFSVHVSLLVTHGLGSLDVEVFVLSSVEALDWELIKTTLASNLLDESDHCLSAVGVETTIISRVNIGHEQSVLISCWISG